MTKKIAEGKTLGLKYEIYDNTGIVEHIEFSREMLITQTRQDYMVHLPTFVGGVPQPRVHQHIRLKGEQTAISVEGPSVADHSGDQLTLFLLTQKHKKNGIYFGSLNHNTSKATDNPSSIRDQLFPWTSFWSILVLGLIAAFVFQFTYMHRSLATSLIATAIFLPGMFLPLYAIGWGIGLIRSIAVRQNREFKAYNNSLRQQLGQSHLCSGV